MTSQYNSDIQSPEFIKKNLRELYVNKTIERVKIFSNQINFNMSKSVYINNIKYPPLSEFVKKINNIIQSKLNNQKLNNLTLMHGDLCFSNILTDSRSNTIKFVDPRGGLNDNFNSNNKIIGDYRYDIAKFGHSLVGNYDYIVTGFYNLKKNKKELNFDFSFQHSPRDSLNNYFFNKVDEMNVDVEFIKISIVNLFISMLPLHNEDKDRQIALLLNAYKLFYD